MSEYTPITDELRERIEQAEHIVPLSSDSKDTQVRINLAWLKEQLDAIDSIHAQLERETASLKAELDRVLGEQEDRMGCIYYDPERHYCSCHDIDTDGLVELPKDADGEVWHIGDRTESGQTIKSMGLSKHGWHFVGTVNEIDPAIHRHYQPPTVEDLLREFARVGIHIAAKHGIKAGEIDFYADEEAIAEYAAKLRLAGDAE